MGIDTNVLRRLPENLVRTELEHSQCRVGARTWDDDDTGLALKRIGFRVFRNTLVV